MPTANELIARTRRKSEASLYKKFLEPTNPYTAYNNTDRFLNVAYRYYTTSPGNADYTRLDRLFRGVDRPIKDRSVFQFESQTNNMSQYFWGTRALVGIGYSVNRAELHAASSETSDWAKVVLARSVITAFLETSLLIANAVRWNKPLFGTGAYRPAVPGIHQGNTVYDDPPDMSPAGLRFQQGLAAGPVEVVHQQIYYGNSEGMIVDNQYGNVADPNPPRPPQGSSVAGSVGFQSVATQAHAIDPVAGRYARRFARFRPLIKNVRTYAGVAGSTGFTLNAIAAVIVNGNSLHNAIYARNKSGNYTDGKEAAIAITSASIAAAASVFSVLTNAAKAADSWGKTMVKTPAGDWLALLDGDLPRGGAYLPGGAGRPNQQNVAQPLKATRWSATTSKRFGYAGSTFGLLNGIAGMATLSPYLFSGNLSQEQKGLIAAEMATQFTGGVGQFYAAQQHMIESKADELRNTIRIGAGDNTKAYFEANLAAQRSMLLADKDSTAYLAHLQDTFKVDSVIAISSHFATGQALELAAASQLTESLVLGKAYGNRFTNGVIGEATAIDADKGTITLGGTAGKNQLLTFLDSLMGFGTESLTRVQKGSGNYFTDLKFMTGGVVAKSWGVRIEDGAASSTVDVRNVVYGLVNSSIPGAPLVINNIIVNGDAGDDTVLAGAGRLVFDGGDGDDIVNYGALDGDFSLVVSSQADGPKGSFTVAKTLTKVTARREVDSPTDITIGTRNESIVTRKVESFIRATGQPPENRTHECAGSQLALKVVRPRCKRSG